MKTSTKSLNPIRGEFIGIPIERGIAIPPRAKAHRGPAGGMSTVVQRLEVGESFAVRAHLRQRLAVTASVYGKRLGRKFVVRELDGFARCWRVK